MRPRVHGLYYPPRRLRRRQHRTEKGAGRGDAREERGCDLTWVEEDGADGVGVGKEGELGAEGAMEGC